MQKTHGFSVCFLYLFKNVFFSDFKVFFVQIGKIEIWANFLLLDDDNILVLGRF